MTQTRLGSLVEATINILVGFGINVIANMLILPLFGFNVTFTQTLEIGLLFTGISILRGYCIRRWFNSMMHHSIIGRAHG